MSEMESSFLVSALGLFRNQDDFGKGYSRANVNLARAYKPAHFYRAATAEAHILHIIGHGNTTQLDVGISKKRVEASELADKTQKAGGAMPAVVISTGCEFQSAAWHAGLKAAGASMVIASNAKVTPAALTAFDMAFYSALLAQVRKGQSLAQRVCASFVLADQHYRAIHAKGTPFAKFTLKQL